MEIIGLGLQAIGSAAGAWATAFGFVYIVSILCKTFLIYTDKADINELKDWFKFWEKRGL